MSSKKRLEIYFYRTENAASSYTLIGIDLLVKVMLSLIIVKVA